MIINLEKWEEKEKKGYLDLFLEPIGRPRLVAAFFVAFCRGTGALVMFCKGSGNILWYFGWLNE